MTQPESVKSITNDANFYLKIHENYAYNTATGIIAQEMIESEF